MNKSVAERRARWSGTFTAPLAAAIRPTQRAAAVTVIRLIHTAIFASVAACVAVVLWDGLHQQPRRRTMVAGAAVLTESAIYLSNDQVCPLSPLAESLGASRGAVTDMLLPNSVSRHIPVVSSAAMLTGIAFNLLAWARRLLPARW